MHFPTFPHEIIQKYGDYVHSIEINNGLAENIQLLEFAHMIQRDDLVEDIITDIVQYDNYEGREGQAKGIGLQF